MDYEVDVVTLQDEEGNEEDFIILEVFEMDDNRYAVLVPDTDEMEAEGDDEDDDIEEYAYIFKVITDENGEETFVDIEDDEEFEKVLNQWESISSEADFEE